MDRYCPECNSTMTPSLVGYLCSNCGNTQRFYTDSGVMPANPSPMPVHVSNPLPSQPTETSNKVSSDNKLQSTLKRLMVPELPPPHSHDQSASYLDSISRPSDTSGIACISGVLDSSGPANHQSPETAGSAMPTPIIAKDNSSTWLLVGLIIMLLLVAGFIAYMLTVGAVTI